ncbi:glycosyltransferase family 4 protein [Tamlana sp. 2_MG-2023]|uniref:glycosyltransferase family 4 protein n=1 Tax=unclassified Tamlana TaxID=2614803 RepID=UPI0026E47421|nr:MULTISPECIES: glycosyltransferase family 4 protein [unclassified Tamlana]MDO6760034.1 glycosyltransferase family 4 protein [Tamlana sp. 2_MG-2023]MDO6790268.1 glycosyltransferase family 4 protein [Tamlana sp. 1_MG-2023]
MNKNLLIIGFVWPEPKSSAAGSRMMQLIETFQSDGYKITFASPCAKSDNAFDLETIGVSQVAIDLNNESFDKFISELNPSVVLFDRFMMEEQFGWRVSEQCPNAIKILDTEDLHCLRKGRQQAFKEGKPFDKSYLFNEVAKREIASIYRCDLSLMISEAEMDLLKNQFMVDTSLLVYLPFMLESISAEAIKTLPIFEAREHFITIGNFLHEPNYNGVLYLKETIWPLIKKQLPKAELHIYGAYATQKVTQLHNEKQGFFIKGFAEDVNTVMKQAKACLVPVRFGAGLKGKLVDAMQNGTPSIMSSIASEGMFGDFEPNGFIEDDPQEFANKAVEIYQNQSLWTEKQQNGFPVINERFSKVEFQKTFLNLLNDTFLNLEERRLNNFTGQMLQHHSMQSTKFMSKWIEEKNRV